MKTIFLLLINLSISYETFAKKEFFNENYKLQKKEIRIALMPFLSSDSLYTETICETLLQDSLAKVKLADIKIITHNILTNSLLNETMRKVIAREYLSYELRHSPNLSQFINENSLTNMKYMLDTSDILLIPSDIQTRTIEKLNGIGNTTVYGRFRLYDLSTGEYIFDFFVEKKVPYLIAKNEIKKLMRVVLDEFHSYFYKYFISRYNLNEK